jgi:membrane associated rhomboid family serine protease
MTCYRHPDRPTRIRCTRCDRPICTECMIPAAVGFQCPDDVREGQRSMRAAAPRSLAGGRALLRPGSVTIAIIVVNVLVFLVQQANASFTGRFVLFGYAVQSGQYYRLLTAAFLHANITHIAFNMFSLYVIGTQVERVLGTVRYAVLYLLAAVGGTAASYAFTAPGAASLGASGAIFGLLGALLVIVRRLRLDPGQLLAMLGLNLAFGFLVPGIDWRAHLGGLFVGALVAWGFTYAPQRARPWAHPLVAVVVAVALAGVVEARTSAQHALFSGSVTTSLGPQGFDDLVQVGSQPAGR